jgi:ribosomal protein L29
VGYRDELEAGRDAFGHLIRVWHERNGWSQRVLPALADALELGRVHNSQLSNLRNRKLASPGPELFVALGRINQLLGAGLQDSMAAPLADQPELLTALQQSALPLLADDGSALGPAQLFEIFVGLRPLPGAFDLRIQAAEAEGLSAALAELFTAGRPWRLCREQLLAAYPAEKRQRRDRFAEVMAGQRDFSAEELDAELNDLRRTLATLGATDEQTLSADQFLELLRNRARLLAQPGSEEESVDLAEAIRRQLQAG